MIEQFIKSNFLRVAQTQSSFYHDSQIVKAVKEKTLDTKIVKSWMRSYSLFQGITGDIRDRIASDYINFAYDNRMFKEDEIDKKFKELHGRLKSVKDRKWISASSKLLWCLQPEIVVMYDSYVERAVSVLQCCDVELAKLHRVNSPPNIKKDIDSREMTKHYMNYQDIVKLIYRKYLPLIEELKKRNQVEYKYDIRIIDKLLWIMGNASAEFTVNEFDCKVGG